MRRPLAFALAATVALPAAAFTDADAIAPQTLRIALCRDAATEIARQADVWRGEMDAWQAFRRGLAAELSRGAARLAEEHRRARAVEEQAVAAARSLVPLGGDAAHVPHIGWGIFGYFAQRRDDTNRAIAEAEGVVSAGDYGFHVAGQGWMTGDSLEAAIAAAAQERANLDAAVADGLFAIAYPGLGWINRQGVEGCIAAAEAEIAQIRATIAAGDYAVAIPGIGWVNRNGLRGMIDAAEAELKGIEDALTGGTLGIARQGHGWFNREGLEAWIAGNEAARAEIGRQLGDGVYAYAFPSGGWLNGQGIDAMIAEREAGIAEVRRQEGSGLYAVPSALGWVNGEGARAALALPTCRENGPTPCIPAEYRPHYQDALRRIPVAVATDVAIRQFEIDRLRAWRAAFEAHAAPDLQRLETERKIHGTLAAEFDQDLAAQRARIGRHIAWLRAAMDHIP